MGRKFAQNTTVSVERSQAELKLLLQRYGATQFGVLEDDENGNHAVAFRCEGRMVRIVLPMPAIDGSRKSDQERRRLWRALILSVKAKLEAIASDISTFDAEFLPYIVMPDNRVCGEMLLPAVAEMCSTSRPLLPLLEAS